MTEQDFYDKLAIFFDVMTDWPGRLAFEMPFILRQVGAAPRRVLDAACGTGWHSIALAQAGYDVLGADISPAMAARARENAISQGVNVTFAVSSFADLPSATSAGFDAIICLGNSLVHVLDEDGLRRSLAGMAACLKPGGVLLLHNLNYDKRMIDRPRWFQVSSGDMDGKETLVWRFADYNENLVTFNISVFQKDSAGQWSVQVQSTPQRPWQSHELVGFLQQAGFGGIEMYGNLAGEVYGAAKSGDLVIVTRKL